MHQVLLPAEILSVATSSWAHGGAVARKGRIAYTFEGYHNTGEIGSK